MGRPKKKFLGSLRVGNFGQRMIEEELIKLFGVEILETHNGGGWDFKAKLQEKIFLAESKFDIRSAETGNIAIEFFNSKIGKPSGISSTISDVWFYLLPDMTKWFASVLTIKQFLVDVKPLRTVYGGGDNNSDMVLYKKEDILPSFHQLGENSLPHLLEIVQCCG